MKKSKWNDEKISSDLEQITKQINHFPKQSELKTLKRFDLERAIAKHGGLDKFRGLLGYEPIQKPDGYWTDEIISNRLEEIINKHGDFPTHSKLMEIKEYGLKHAITKHGGYNKFRDLLGYDIIKKPDGFWTDDLIVKDLQLLIKGIGHFPSELDLIDLDRQDLFGAIASHGGYPKFRELLGYSVSMREKYISELASYNNKRGKNSEKIVKKILTDYCNIHRLTLPSYNTRLSKGNVIEFVCNNSKKIGIDVTNTQKKTTVYYKWSKKDYYKYLDELWIVVLSDSFSSQDYHKWNQDSPDNVKVMSIYQFLDELDYSLDEHTKSKIDKYCKCTFHTKEEFIKYKSSNTDKNTYTILPNTKYNLCII